MFLSFGGEDTDYELPRVEEIFAKLLEAIESRGVNVRPNPRTRHELDTGFFGLGLGLNGFGS